MPLYSHNEVPLYPVTLAETMAEQQPRIAKPAYRSAVVETRFTPLGSLLTTVEGYPWPINYFSRVLGADEIGDSLDPQMPPIWQQYLRINNLILKVSQPLEYVQQEESNDPLWQGEAQVHRSVVPNAGDVFLADGGDGHEAIFQVTSAERKSIFKEAVFVIRYVFKGYSDGDQGSTWLTSLLTKVVDERYYDDEYSNRLNGPLLSGAEVNLRKELAESRTWLINQFCSKFYSARLNTFLYPDNFNTIYDPGVIRAITSLVNGEECPAVFYRLNPYRMDGRGGVGELETWTFWDMLLEAKYNKRTMVNPKAWKISSRSFAINLTLGTIAYSGIQYVIVPYGQMPGRIESCSAGGVAPWDIVHEDSTPAPGERPLFFSVVQDDYYVMTQAFYEDTAAQMSELETAVKKYTTGTAYDGHRILEMCRAIASRSELDQFYYIPVLIALTYWALHQL